MTTDIAVSVKTHYIADQSDPTDHRFVYAYTITIRNQSNIATKLLSRHWLITNGNNNVQEVRGEGVVGEQPHLEPGEEYTYTSGVVLETEIGTMEGSYQMVTDNGDTFDAQVPTFALVPPHALH
ncbi:Co2+/Mg2+ efflux protein ApaG [Halioxenophilus aromaticivorans]|uniref:Protein ApaG n=1 Tax=Halioxenophilus aromaticivorans TaxID=1306992 RepID=A0AAV3U9I0_9ALTE